MRSHIIPNPENIVKINVPGTAARSPEPPSTVTPWDRLMNDYYREHPAAATAATAAATSAVCRLRVIHSTDWITLWHALRRRAAL